MDLKAEGIRKRLIEEFSYTEDEVNSIKGISALREELNEAEKSETKENLELEETKEEFGSVSEEIDVTSPKWNDYVLSLFESDELIDYNGDKRPNVHGLRRVSQKLFGEMLYNEVDVLEAPTEINGYVATCKCSVLFYDNDKARERKFSDVADVSLRNCPELYAKHPSSTAATKAEARALRKLLQLKSISSEESISIGSIASEDRIDETQIIGLDLICKRNNINVVEFVNSSGKQYKNIKEVSYETAHRFFSIINDNDKLKEFKEAKPNIIGYMENWRTNFG